MKLKNLIIIVGSVLFLLLGCSQKPQPSLNQNGDENPSPRPSKKYTFETIPVKFERLAPVAFKLPNQQTHWYEVIYLPEGGINWVEAKHLAELAGGYLVTLHSKEENEFVFSLIKDRKYWFEWDSRHNYVMSGPFIGAYQPKGSSEPKGGWKWVSGEPWTYNNWCRDGVKEDRDPRPNDQPNNANGNQNVAAYGEINDPVPYWGDFPHKFSTFNSPFKGKTYAFIIEYNQKPE